MKMVLNMMILSCIFILASQAVAFDCEIAGTYKSGNAYIMVTKEPDSYNLYWLELFDKQLGCEQFLNSKAYQSGPVFLTPRGDKQKERYEIRFRSNCTEAQVVWPPHGFPQGCENFFTDPKTGNPWIFNRVKE